MTPEAHRHTARQLALTARWAVLRAKDELEAAGGRDLAWTHAADCEGLLTGLIVELASVGERDVFACKREA